MHAWPSPAHGPASGLTRSAVLRFQRAPSRACRPSAASPGGLPSIAISGGFTSFGRQSTNPQWQNPSLADPKLNFTWIKGRHSLKFGYEWEKVWQEIEDSNPLYGSFSYGGGYSKCPTAAGLSCPNTSAVADTDFADFLFGTSSAYLAGNLFHHPRLPADGQRLTPRMTGRSARS